MIIQTNDLQVEKLITIPIKEYEHLKQCEKQLLDIQNSMLSTLRNRVNDFQQQANNCKQPINNIKL